jgi:membrane associated rhomboid family serine protease
MLALFVVFTVVYVGALVFLKPAPTSLHDTPDTRLQSVKKIKGSLSLGLGLILIFAITNDMQNGKLGTDVYLEYALDNYEKSIAEWAKQLLGHSFLHFDFMHLASNVVGIGLASLYERRVGTGRFLIIYAIGCFVSALSVFTYSGLTSSVGASGGLFALAGAYFVDFGKLTLKQWITGLAICIIVLVAFSLYGVVRDTSSNESPISVDYIAHAIGAVSAIIFVALRPRRGAQPTSV